MCSNIQYSIVPALITVPPRDQAAKVGEEVMFTCAATGIPEPTIEWFFEETNKVLCLQMLIVPMHNSVITATAQYYSLIHLLIQVDCLILQLTQNGPRLHISDITINKQGTYKCKASNSPDTTATASARLTIYGILCEHNIIAKAQRGLLSLLSSGRGSGYRLA